MQTTKTSVYKISVFW